MVLIVVIQIVHAKIVLVKTALADNSKAIVYFAKLKKSSSTIFWFSSTLFL
jgi:hypothetical protein